MADRGEAIQVMIDGGLRLCDYAETQWIAGKYHSDEQTTYDNLQRWKRIRALIPELGKELKRVQGEF